MKALDDFCNCPAHAARHVFSNWLNALWLLPIALALQSCNPQPAFIPGRLEVLHTVSTRAMTSPCGCCGGQTGGLAQRATHIRLCRENTGAPDLEQKLKQAGVQLVPWKEQLKGSPPASHDAGQAAELASLVLCDCGSFTDGTTATSLSKSVFNARAMQLIGYDFVNLGLEEIALGHDQLVPILAEFTSAQVVSANVSFTQPAGGPGRHTLLNEAINPWVRANRNGIELLVTGLASPIKAQSRIGAGNGVEISPIEESIETVIGQARPGEAILILTDGLVSTEARDLLRSIQGKLDAGAVNTFVLIGELKNYIPDEFKLNYSVGAESGLAILPGGLSRGQSIMRSELDLLEPNLLRISSLANDQLPRSMHQDEQIAQLLDGMAREITGMHTGQHALVAANPPEGAITYVGPGQCAACHSRIAESCESTKHLHAYRALVERGESASGLCLPCHTTGYGEPGGFLLPAAPEAFRNVTCEACHGPGGLHLQFVQGLAPADQVPGVNSQGLQAVSEQTCRTCHDESNDPDFVYETRLRQVLH